MASSRRREPNGCYSLSNQQQLRENRRNKDQGSPAGFHRILANPATDFFKSDGFQMDLSTQRASTSAPWSRRWKHDVFLSFRGETRNGFTDHLFTALQRVGIKVFRDREIHIGANIFLELLTAIEKSRFAIVVISPDFASSTWCLVELSKMFDCMEGRNAILPIFYGVDPSDVRKQTGTFAEAFIKHEKKQDRATLHRWRTALTKVAGLRGWNLIENWSEADFIQEIVDSVWGKLGAHAYCNVQLTNPQTTGLAETYSYFAPSYVSTGEVVASRFAPANSNVTQARNSCEAGQLMLPDPNHGVANNILSQLTSRTNSSSSGGFGLNGSVFTQNRTLNRVTRSVTPTMLSQASGRIKGVRTDTSCRNSVLPAVRRNSRSPDGLKVSSFQKHVLFSCAKQSTSEANFSHRNRWIEL